MIRTAPPVSCLQYDFSMVTIWIKTFFVATRRLHDLVRQVTLISCRRFWPRVLSHSIDINEMCMLASSFSLVRHQASRLKKKRLNRSSKHCPSLFRPYIEVPQFKPFFQFSSTLKNSNQFLYSLKPTQTLYCWRHAFFNMWESRALVLLLTCCLLTKC